VIPGNKRGNNMIFAYNEIIALRNHGIDAYEITLDISISVIRFLKSFITLKKEINKHKPQIVHAQFGSITALISALAVNTSIKYVITFRGSDLNPSPYDGIVRNIFQKLLSQIASLRASVIICVSEELKSRLLFKQRVSRVITTGVDLEKFYPMNQEMARKHCGLELNKKIILFVGGSDSSINGKRLDLAKRSIELVKMNIVNAYLLVLNGVSHVKMKYYYNACDCLVFTSDFEGSPCVIQEAIACNLPIVSVDVGDVRERLFGIDYSYIVDRTPQDISEAIVKVLSYNKRTNVFDTLHVISQKDQISLISDLYYQIIN